MGTDGRGLAMPVAILPVRHETTDVFSDQPPSHSIGS